LTLSLAESVRKRAGWLVMIQAAQQELYRAAPGFGVQLGPRWEPPAVPSVIREAIVESWNSGAREREKAISTPDPTKDPGPAPELPRESTVDGREERSEGEHYWSAEPVPLGGEPLCNEREGCNAPAVLRLTYDSPTGGHRTWLACEEHGKHWAYRNIGRHRQRQRPPVHA
jgi:hypothetical protein